jgi:hypothetical protein
MNTKDSILAVRQDFFDALLREWSRPPDKIDELMGHAEFFMCPAKNREIIRDDHAGILFQEFAPPPSWGETVQFSYSVLHAGDWLRFGILLSGAPLGLSRFAEDQNTTLDIEKIWDRPADQSLREGGLLLEWRFVEPNFYQDYAIQERFIQMARHLHFQIGRSVHASAA